MVSFGAPLVYHYATRDRFEGHPVTAAALRRWCVGLGVVLGLAMVAATFFGATYACLGLRLPRDDRSDERARLACTALGAVLGPALMVATGVVLHAPGPYLVVATLLALPVGAYTGRQVWPRGVRAFKRLMRRR